MLTPGSNGDRTWGRSGGMRYAAVELMEAARRVAGDPFAESPFMERAVEEGLPMAGGEWCCYPWTLSTRADSV
jgi:hypothetical protein